MIENIHHSDQKHEQRFLGSRLYRRRAGILEPLPRWVFTRWQRFRRSKLQTKSLAAENRL